jgi:hypothetical protein
MQSGSQQLTINGISTSSSFTASLTPMNFYLFGSNDADVTGAYSPAKIKLYYARYYDNLILVRDFIPCYVNTEVVNNEITYLAGTIGLYDLVENKFYTNQGTGEFLKGNEVLSGEFLALQSEIPEITANLENEPTEILDKLTIEGTTYKVSNPKYNITEITMDEENIYITIE